MTHDVTVVLPTYNEAGNITAIADAILTALPGARLIVVDDNSPDGTGVIADAIAASDPRVSVLHRTSKDGLAAAYLAGFAVALESGARAVIQMDADFSHDPAALPRLVAPVLEGAADLVIGSRWVVGGSTVGWPLRRQLISRAGSLYARTLLGLPVRDLTGGYKAWASETLRVVIASPLRSGGYVFQIEMTYRALSAGARLEELPIVFRERVTGVSKMSGGIVREAATLVVRLRLEAHRRR